MGFTLREEQRALTRTRVIEAAVRVFARSGFHGASVHTIAREAGVTTGAIYSNFAGKEDLFFAVFEEHIARQIHEYTARFEHATDVEARSRGGADYWMAQVRDDPHFFPLYMEFWAHAVRDSQLRPRFAARFGVFRELFARLIEEGARDIGVEPPPGFAQRMGTVLNALGNGLALEKLTDPDAVPDELLGDTIALIFNALVVLARSEEGTDP